MIPKTGSQSPPALSRSNSQGSVNTPARAPQAPPSPTSSAPSSPKGAPPPAANDKFQQARSNERQQELAQLKDQKLVSSLPKKSGPQAPQQPVNIGVPIRADNKGGAHTYDLHSIQNINSSGASIRPQALPPAPGGTKVPATLEDKATLPGNLNELRTSANPKQDLNGVHGLYIPGAPAANNTQVTSGRSNDATDASLNRVQAQPTKKGEIFKTDEHNTRSDYELKLLNEAQNRGMPIMGVCAGSWRVLESYGGQVETLPKNERDNHKAATGNPWALNHDVQTTPGSMLHGVSQPGPAKGRQETTSTIPAVNSTHWAAAQTVKDGNGHEKLAQNPQSAKNPNDMLEVSAKATGTQGKNNFAHPTVEAFESKHGAPVMGIQWHPESYQPNMPGAGGDKPAVDSGRKIMQSFGEASQTYQRKQDVLAEIKQTVPQKPPTTE